jgi:asparagine synthase (glutamine-hydrolysing)
MCGIAGVIGGQRPGRRAIDQTLAALYHRGPDSCGVWQNERATLLHTRLRVLDLSEAAAQPMASDDGAVVVTFNGELYNFVELRRELEAAGYRFRSRSDTEVLVHGYREWGDGVVDRVDGMFAFAIWDERQRRLLLARDRVGKKPVFWRYDCGQLSFASEAKGLFTLGAPCDVDPAALPHYLTFGYVPPPGTFYRAVRQLPPGHLLEYLPAHGREPTPRRYWNVRFTSERRIARHEAAAEVRARVVRAVERRMAADVPVGAFLSGGIDSTIIVGVMARTLGIDVQTFSIGFQDGEGQHRAQAYDETDFARHAAEAFGTRHTEFVVRPSDFELTEQLIWHHDGPFGDSSAIPTYVVSKLARSHVTVALTGDGGDELFAGYLRLVAAAAVERVPGPLRWAAGRVGRLLPTGGERRGRAARVRRLLAAAGLGLADRLLGWNSFFTEEAAGLWPGLDREPPLRWNRELLDAGRPASPLSLALTHNFHGYLPQDLLVKADRASMACSLELRSPLLDVGLLESVKDLLDALRVEPFTPAALRSGHGGTKAILRHAFADLLPARIIHRGKMGFGLPLGRWFRGPLRPLLRDHLAPPSAALYRYVAHSYVSKLMNRHLAGTHDASHQLWALLCFELWLRSFATMATPRRAAHPAAERALAGVA